MTIIFFLFFIFSTVYGFSQNCEQIAMRAYDYGYLFQYENAFKIFIENYEKCKEDCNFMRLYNLIFSVSSDKYFNLLKERDIEKQKSCETNHKPIGAIFYYFRTSNYNELSKFDENIIKKILGDYIYFLYFKNYTCNFIIELYKNNKKILDFANPSAAYLLCKCGNIEAAKEIASVRYNHFKEKIKREGLFPFGVPPSIILERLIFSIIFNLEHSKTEKERLKKAKEFFPYIFRLYDLLEENK